MNPFTQSNVLTIGEGANVRKMSSWKAAFTIAGLAIIFAAAAVARADNSLSAGATTTLAAAQAPNPQDQIKGLAAIFGPAWSLTYQEAMVVKQYGSNSGLTTQTLIITGELTKPSKYYYNLGTAGYLISDGITNLATDSAKKRYTQYPAPHDLVLGEYWDFVSTHVLHNAKAFNYAIAAYLFEHSTDVDMTQPTDTVLTASNTTFNSKSAVDVDYKSAASDVHIYLDPKAHTLLGAHSVYTDRRGQVTDTTETFAWVRTSSAKEPDADFSIAPPAGATYVPLPKPPAPKPRPPVTHHTAPKVQRPRQPNYLILP